jgi:hypothetical protein
MAASPNLKSWYDPVANPQPPSLKAPPLTTCGPGWAWLSTHTNENYYKFKIRKRRGKLLSVYMGVWQWVAMDSVKVH